MLTVWAVDPGRVRRGGLEVLECTVILREMDIGTWQVTVRDDELSRRVGEGWRVLVMDDGEEITSGRVLTYGGDEDGDAFTFAGEDDLADPAARLVYPDPSRSGEAQTSAAYYVRRGPAETVVRDMIHANAGTGAIASRRIAGFTVTASQGRGTEVSTNLRFKNLLEESRALARLGGVTFSAIQEEDSRTVLRFREPRDLSRRVRFARGNGGLETGTWSVTAPTVTSVLVAGQGQGTARTIEEHATDPGPWGLRIEQFQDRRDTDDAAELEQAGTETLAEGAESASASVSTTELEGLRFGRDFLLGDTVLADFGRAQIIEPVRAAELSWDGHGRTAKLTLGDHAQDEDQDPAWVKHVRALGRRQRGLETI